MKAACIEAAERPTEVEDFEVGVFCGKYVTEVPKGYFGHLSDLRNGKREQENGLTDVKAGDNGATVVASSGPTNEPRDGDDADELRNANGIKTPEDREDIRYVASGIETVLCHMSN